MTAGPEGGEREQPVKGEREHPVEDDRGRPAPGERERPAPEERERPTEDERGRPAEDGREQPTADADESGDDDRPSIPLETLAVLNWLGEIGIRGVESRLGKVASDELPVQTEQVKVGYAEPESVPAQFSAAENVGVRVPLRTVFEGNVMVLFPIESGERAAALMVRSMVDDVSSVSNEMGRDALTELGNMMANGFIDQWATVFETSIDTSSPIPLQNPEQTLARHALRRDELGLYITSRLRIPKYDIEAAIYVFPGEQEFITKISRVGIEVVLE